MYAHDQLLEEERPHATGDGVDGPVSIALPVGTSLFDIERVFILATLQHFGGDKRAAAQVLGCSVKTLYNKLHLYRRRLLRAAATGGSAGISGALAPVGQSWGGSGTKHGSRMTRSPPPVVGRDDDDREREAAPGPNRRTTCAAAS